MPSATAGAAETNPGCPPSTPVPLGSSYFYPVELMASRGLAAEQRGDVLVDCVEVRGQLHPALPAARGTRTPRCLDSDEPDARVSGLGDDDVLAGGCTFDEVGQVGLGLVDVDLRHALMVQIGQELGQPADRRVAPSSRMTSPLR